MTTVFKNKVALVTGASRGIGAATAKRLAAGGASVVITYSKSPDAANAVVKAIEAAGGKAVAYQADAANPASMKALVASVVKDLGGIDILVNNAGTFITGTIGEIAQADYDQIMKTNVDGVFHLTNAAVPHMKSGARIINISSVLGERATGAAMSVYNASKFAVNGLTRSWAKDLGAKGILVNAVQPGPINTEMNPDDSDHADYMRSQTALGRYGTPEEVAAAVVFFASPEASYISGATLDVDGGWNA